MRKSKKPKPLKPSIYNAMIDKVTGHKDGTVTVQMSLFGKGIKFTERFSTRPIPEETDPEKGLTKFFVLAFKFAVYTSIGADNRHHAANKATKLFGPNWSQVRPDHSGGAGYSFVSVADFKELLKTLPN